MADIIHLQAGSTESAIQAALAGLGDGDTLVLAANETIAITQGLNLNVSHRSITLDLNGSTLQQAGDHSVISVDGTHVAGETARLGYASDGAVTVTYNSGSKVGVGGYVKIYSDDILTNDQGAATRLGQAMKVVAVQGDTLVLEGDLADAELYRTNIRASEYVSGTAVVQNGTVRGDKTHPAWTDPLVSVRSTVDARLDHLTVRDGNSMGINIVDSVNALVTQAAAFNLTDDTPNGHYGYGVHSASSLNTTVEGFYADKVRHATDDNAVGLTSTDVNPSKYGADIGFTVSDVIANATTAFAFSWHSEGRLASITDSLVFNSYGVLGGRGVDNSLSNVSGAGNYKGILFYEYGDGDGRRITVSNVNLKENTGFAYFKQNDPQQNSLSNSVFEILSSQITISPDDRSTALINNSVKVGSFATDETIVGTGLGDQLLGAKGVDVISGGAGNDYIWGGLGSDILVGGSGIDRFAYHVMGEAGDVIADFRAGTGGDVVDLAVLSRQLGWSGDLGGKGYVAFVQSGADTLLQVDSTGGANSFVTMATLKGVTALALTSANISTDIEVTNNGDTNTGKIISTPGSTVIVPAPDAFSDYDDLPKQLGTTLDDILYGTTSADLLVGFGGNDILRSGEGNDILAGGAGADILRGGSGKDQASYADALSAVTASLSNPGFNTGDAKGDFYSQVEGLIGSMFGDKLTGTDTMNALDGGAGADQLYGLGGMDRLSGGAGNDMLYGGLQNDTLDGGADNDLLVGGAGYDRLTGGIGADTFQIDLTTTGSDTVVDFEHGVDKIMLGSGFRAADLADISFVTGDRPVADTLIASLLYNSSSGALWWDADGNGAGDPVQIACFVDKPVISLSDFILL